MTKVVLAVLLAFLLPSLLIVGKYVFNACYDFFCNKKELEDEKKSKN